MGQDAQILEGGQDDYDDQEYGLYQITDPIGIDIQLTPVKKDDLGSGT